jgi:CRISPR-associated protein Cmr3
MPTTWIIEPRDPLIVRDGKPFGPNPGARATSLPFPFPSTTTGGARTLAGLDANGSFNSNAIAEVKQIGVRGPLLVELNEDRSICWLAPAPADALLLDDPTQAKTAICKRLVPLDAPPDLHSNLPADLHLVGMTMKQYAPDKPFSSPPRFWYWDQFESWLINAATESSVVPSSLGHSGPIQEVRTHVRLDPDTLTAMESFLFQTRGLEFTGTAPDSPTYQLSAARRMALAVVVDDTRRSIPGGPAALGGERRIVCWRASSETLPACPQAVRTQMLQQRACRVVLLTPAHFTQGYAPTWLRTPRHGITPQIQAIAVPRPQVVSGWDMERKTPGPKASRRLAPAGSVIFLSLEGGTDANLTEWIDKTWMQCISDDPQDRLDGFGLAVLGTWSGTPAAYLNKEHTQ